MDIKQKVDSKTYQDRVKAGMPKSSLIKECGRGSQ